MRLAPLPLLLVSITFSAPVLAQQTNPLAASASQTQPNQPGRVQSPTTSLQDSSGAPGDTMQQMRDRMFLRKATEGRLAEIEMGKLATQKSSSEEVKTFGQKMAEDHGRLNEEMAEIADSLGVKLSKQLSKADHIEYDRLNQLSGDEFDREYITWMVKSHREDLREFRIASNTAGEPDLMTTAYQGARMIHQHMVAADKLARDRGIAVPGRRPKAGEASAQSTPPAQ